MILRQFSFSDWPVIHQYQSPNLSETEIKAIISQWSTHQYDGRYFEMLAIEVDGDVVGYVSLFEQEDGIVSEGVEIYLPYRRLGYAYSAVTILLQRAHSDGLKTVTAQIRQDNVASLKLHKKLGFETTGSFTNKRGHLVYALSKDL